MAKNNYNGYMTGCGSATVMEGQNYSDICDQYITTNGLQASTTGNVTGIYDMSGGSYEYVAGYRANTYGYSGFDETSIASYDSKYFDVYNEASTQESYNYRILGDATGEMGPFADGKSSWYGNYATFVTSVYPWLGRGGSYSHENEIAGIFSFSRNDGYVINFGTSARIVLAL